MQVPLELAFRDVPRSSEIEALVARRVDRLEKFATRIVACRVAVERPHKRPHGSGLYRVRVDVTVPPGHEIVARKESDPRNGTESLITVIQEAFDAAERQLKDLTDRQRGEVKAHPDEPRGFVVRLFPEEGYGFIKTVTDREIYFHRNAVAHDDFDRLSIGTEVRFVERMGEEGAQASTVQVVAKPGERVRA